MCSGFPRASRSTSMMFFSACLNWPAKSRASHLPSPVQPIWPAMNTRRPFAAMPLEKPLARAQPGGWSICILVLPQLETLDLAGLGARQRVGELDDARIFVRSDRTLDVVLERFLHVFALLAPRLENDEGFHHGAAIRVRRADHAALGHGRMREQRTLHFRAGDVVARRDDHVVGARLE